MLESYVFPVSTEEELKSMQDNEVRDLTEFSNYFKPIVWKCVYKLRRNSKYKIERLKVNLVAKVWTQPEGIYCN